MFAALITGKRTVEFIEFADPTPAPAGVVVDISYCGICGTDVHAYRSGQPYAPAICGHEWTGVVSDVGRDVRSLGTGDRVVVATAPSCGQCAACLHGQADQCRSTFRTSVGRDPLAPPHGGFAPRIAVAATRVVRVDPLLTDEQAAQVEPATVAFHAVRTSALRLGDTAVIQGAGPIGLATLQWVRAAGAGRTIVVEPNMHRRATARLLGAHDVVEPGDAARSLIEDRTHGLGADVVYECVGHAAAVQSAVDLARRGGSMCLIGLADDDAPIATGSWLVKELAVTSALAYRREEFEMAMGMIADGRVHVDLLHTSTVRLEGIVVAFDDLAQTTSEQTKVLVNPNW